MRLTVKAVDSLTVVVGNTVEKFLLECGYLQKEINILKRPFTKLISLPDGCVLFRRPVLSSIFGYGYLYILTDNLNCFYSNFKFVDAYNLLMLTEQSCSINVKEK